MPHTIDNRKDYVLGTGYDVTLRVTYTRRRRVRALNEEQAKEFAVAREWEYVPNYFSTKKYAGFDLTSVEVLSVKGRGDADG